jgi:hypothetical protein
VATTALLSGCATGPPVRRTTVLLGKTEREVAGEIDRVGGVFRLGLHAGFEHRDDEALLAALAAVPVRDRPVAWEGAAMAVAFGELDRGGAVRWRRLLDGRASKHSLSLALGLGWALSWKGIPPDPEIAALDPLLRWRVADGYGFRDGFVQPLRHVLMTRPNPGVGGFAREVWWEGVGRSIWYSARGDVPRTVGAVQGFPAEQRAAVWKGVGLAVTWVGDGDHAAMLALRDASGAEASWLGVGAAMAARARRDVDALTPRQEVPCQSFAGTSALEAASVTDAAEAELSPEPEGLPPYARWMNGIEARLRV